MYQNKQEKGEKNGSGCNLFVKQEYTTKFIFFLESTLWQLGEWQHQQSSR